MLRIAWSWLAGTLIVVLFRAASPAPNFLLVFPDKILCVLSRVTRPLVLAAHHVYLTNSIFCVFSFLCGITHPAILLCVASMHFSIFATLFSSESVSPVCFLLRLSSDQILRASAGLLDRLSVASTFLQVFFSLCSSIPFGWSPMSPCGIFHTVALY